MAFVGMYEHTLDAKGRFVLPSKFRAHLADRAYITPGSGCLHLYPPDAFTETVARMREEVRNRETDPNVMRGFSAFSQEVGPDSQGRIIVPERLRTFAGLDREIVVNGNFEHVEIWDATRFANLMPQLDETVAAAIAGGSGL